MSFMEQYNRLPPNFGKQSLPAVQHPMASLTQMMDYDKAKRKNNGLIIALVVIVILLVAAIVAIFVLLYGVTITPGSTDGSAVSNTLTMQMKVLRKDVTYSANYADSSQDGFKLLVTTMKGHVVTIATENGYSLSGASATTMSAGESGGVQIDDFTIVMPLGSQSLDTAFLKMSEAIVANVPTPFEVQARNIVRVVYQS